MSKRERSPGHWEIKIYIGQVGGEEQYEYFTFVGGRREADDEEARLRAKYGRGAIARPKAMTVGQWMDLWLADYVKPIRAPKTYENYEQATRLRIKPALGDTPLRKLSPGQIQRMYTDMRTQRLDRRKGEVSASTIHGVHRVLRAALERAVVLGYIPSNPALRAVPPTPEEYEPMVLADDAVEQFLDAARGHRLYALFETVIFAGCRVGELLGLTWADVDWDARTLRVARALQDVHGQPLYVGRTKSKAGRRTVVLADRTVDALRAHKARQSAERLRLGPGYHDNDLIFCAPDGTFLNPAAPTRVVKRICRRAGLPPMRFHDLRHTHGTMLEADNTDPRTMAQRLGHSDPSFTVKKYTHMTQAMQRAPVARLNARFGGSPSDKNPDKSPKNEQDAQGS